MVGNYSLRVEKFGKVGVVEVAGNKRDGVRDCSVEELDMIIRILETLKKTKMQPKETYYDIVLKCEELVPISVIAKDYGLSAKRLLRYLHCRGIHVAQNLIRFPYRKFEDKGYTKAKTFTATDAKGEAHTRIGTYWTQAGRLFIYDLLKSDGILPIIERGESGHGREQV